ncbi:GNAT family N-acetyltransferase [Arsenicitalea aurantiaca]|uniref:GNAT family N-acetyltransferase n=1 Tax=Arsenicitalea aurantiaca TaxID=1783274 RepID=A0A433XKH7_9HYPH|nr:GNAT family N-acetyltransferase [Arsenicitalea aurantiaca]RUT34592.1 GNAT family N-acetyltransferase [Arsenicitalea aurantiaca]
MNAIGPAERFDVSIVSDTAELPADWPRRAGEADCHVFQLAPYLALLARTMGRVDGRRLHFVSVRDESGAPLLFLALASWPVGPFRVLGFADFDVSDYNGPALDARAGAWSPERARALWQAIAARLPPHDFVTLEKMPETINGRINPLCLLGAVRDEEDGHGNDLRAGRAAVMARQSQVKTTQRVIRKLEREAGLRLVIAETEAERTRFIKAAIAHKQRRFDETKLGGFHAEPEKRAFFEEGTEALAEAGLLHFAALEIGGEIAATSWNLVLGRRLYAMMLGFDDGQWSRFGPSRLLNFLLLERLLEEGFDFYDLGVGDEAYKVGQCETAIALYRVRFATTARGRIYQTLAETRERLRRTRAWQRLREAKWHVKTALRRRGALRS